MSVDSQNQHPITARHRAAFSRRPESVRRSMDSLAAITWTPGGYHTSFLGRMFRPIGTATMVSMFSHPGVNNHVVHLNGYTAEIGADGYLLGGPDRNVFAYDFTESPRFNAPNFVINPKRNPALGYLGLELDGVRRKYVRNKLMPEDHLVAPSVYLGFAQDAIPDMEDTPMLRARVARNMRRHVGEVDQMDEATRNAFLVDEWPRCVIPPGVDGNNTKFHLINAELCVRAVNWAEQIFERFTELCGVELFNPVRELLNPDRGLENPVREIATSLGIPLPLPDSMAYGDEKERLVARAAKHGIHFPVPTETLGLDQGLLLEKAIRHSLADLNHLVSDYDIVQMVLNPTQRFYVPEGVKDLAKVPDDDLVLLMRDVAGRYADACTDEDLLHAGRHPNQPLFASGLCSIQVLRVDPANLQQSLQFGPERMHNRRVMVDAYGIRKAWADTWASR